jgi:hypothetical protein
MNNETMENLDALNQDDTSTDVDQDDASQDSDAELEKLRKAYENQKIRAEKREAELKALKEQLVTKKPEVKETPTESKPNQSTLSREEAILFAQGYDLEAVDKLKIFSQVEGIGLLEAKEADTFKAWTAARDERRKSEESELSASKGSPKKKKELDTQTPGLSDEEHKALWEKAQKR